MKYNILTRNSICVTTKEIGICNSYSLSSGKQIFPVGTLVKFIEYKPISNLYMFEFKDQRNGSKIIFPLNEYAFEIEAICKDYISEADMNNDDIYNETKNYINANLRDVNVEKLSRKTGITVNKLNSVYFERENLTVNSYIDSLRLKLAHKNASELGEEVSVSYIAKISGYKSKATLTKEFFRAYKMDIEDFRRIACKTTIKKVV